MRRSQEKSKEKIEYIILLNVISAISVVFLHANGVFWTFSTDTYWFSANIIESVFYFAVPIFFMISGATLINYKERYSTSQFFIRRIKKTLIPFVIWSLIGLFYYLLTGKIRVSNLNLEYVINGILGTSIINIYWFFPVLFCCYLCIPLFASVVVKERKKVFSYLAVACFIVNCLIPFINSIWHNRFEWPFSISVGSGYILYLLIGYLLNEYELKDIYKKITYICAVIGLLMHIIGTYYLSMNAGKIIQIFKGYNNVPCILYSVGIWVFFKDYGTKIMSFPCLRGG